MAWTTPMTFTTGQIVTAAQLNTHLRDNLIDLDRRTSPVAGYVATLQDTTSTAYTDLATVGPAVTATIGATGKALVSIFGAVAGLTANIASLMSYAVSGASTAPGHDSYSIGFTAHSNGSGIRAGATILHAGLTPGSNTFTTKYRTDGGGTCRSGDRRIQVTPLGS